MQCSNEIKLRPVLKASEKDAKLIPVREYDLPLLPWQMTASYRSNEGLGKESFFNLLEHLKIRENSLKQQLDSLLSKRVEHEHKESDGKHSNLLSLENIKPKRLEERKTQRRHHSLPNLPSPKENPKHSQHKMRTLSSAVALCSAYGIGGTLPDQHNKTSKKLSGHNKCQPEALMRLKRNTVAPFMESSKANHTRTCHRLSKLKTKWHL